jgi:FkbH-like protein
MNLHDIKLVIWDLDNTLWNGILTEGKIVDNNENYELVKKLTDIGIINSICSKNDCEPVEEELKRIGLQEYFVFKSINWDSKGRRIEQIIKNMNLRAVNVLFIDDDKKNLEEVRSRLPDIHVELPSIIRELENQIDDSFKVDLSHKRLKQYKVLEEKFEDSKSFDKDTDFLASCEIKIKISSDCENEFDRILELINRTNQLNYTKKRLTADELSELLKDNLRESAYIQCKDKYGDYGLIGFYSLKDNELEHFLFSCRTLGMGIETYIYNKLGKPKLEQVGYVINDLTEECPDWIEIVESFGKECEIEKSTETQLNVLFKGPCDLLQTELFFPKNLHITTEFTYVNQDNFSVESFNHSSQILASKYYTNEQKKEIINQLPFVDEKYFNTEIFSGKFDVIIYSMLCDYGLGIYEQKGKNISFVYGQYTNNLLDESSWNKLESSTVAPLKKDFLVSLKENFDYLGVIKPEEMINNLKKIKQLIGKDTLLILLGGAEYNYIEKTDVRKDRYLLHKQYNEAVKEFVKSEENCCFIDVNKYIKDESSFVDTINHYKKTVYFDIANEIIKHINEYSDIFAVNEISKHSLLKIQIMDLIKNVARKLIPYKVRLFIKRRIDR